jgi:asparagine synthase (glutamine-hydrolysing)
VVTGLDGDGLFGDWTFNRAWSVLTGRAQPVPRDLLRIARLAAPAGARGWLGRRRLSLNARWLLPAAALELEHSLARELAGEPRRWDLRVDWWARSRVLAALCDGLGVLARDVGTRLVHPLLDRTFLAAMARAGARSGFGDRTTAMRSLFGDLLPPQVLARSDKALFTFVYFTDRSRAFAERWNGDGVRRDLVDPESLRATWLAAPPASPDMRSGLLLQAAWLAGSGADVQRHFNCDLE